VPASTVFELAVVGTVAVFQQTPRAVMDWPPSAVTLPPLAAEALVMPVIGAVVTVGAAIREA
jgi:hypothetical protein